MEIEFENIMDHIVESIRAAGYEPYDQLYGYMKTGDETYITRSGDARKLIMLIYGKEATTQIENSVPYYSVSKWSSNTKMLLLHFHAP